MFIKEERVYCSSEVAMEHGSVWCGGCRGKRRLSLKQSAAVISVSVEWHCDTHLMQRLFCILTVYVAIDS